MDAQSQLSPGHDPRSGYGAPGQPPFGTGQAASGTSLPITWQGNPWSLTGLSFINFLLSLVTLGIYGFWGRTEVRRRIWSSIRLAGEPLEYTGTGKELFLGFLFVLFAVFLPLLLVAVGAQFAFGPQSGMTVGVQFTLYAIFFYLVGVALYRARRYRLARTNWRGIRGALVGNSWAYGWASFWTALLIPLAALVLATVVSGVAYGFRMPGAVGGAPPNLSPGVLWATGLLSLLLLIGWLWLVPWRATKLYRHLTNDMTFGDQPFAFVGSARPLYARFVARWIGVVILALITLAALYATGVLTKIGAMMQASQFNIPADKQPKFTGRELGSLIAILLVASFLYSIITAWYRAAQANILTGFTRVAGVPLKLAVSAGGLIWLFVTNYLIGMLSFGILRPVAEARAAQYFVERFAIDGPLDLARIAQSQAALGRTGEGLAQAFDVDAF